MFLIYISLVLSYTEPVSSIKCVGKNACIAQTITCPQEADCYIECSGNHACSDTNILCPTGYMCNIKCQTSPQIDLATNKLTCYKMIIHASHSTILNLTVNLGDHSNTLSSPRTFEDAQIYCPHNIRNTNIKPCQIYCNGDDLMRRTVIYSINGLNDVNIESISYSDAWCIRGATIKCTDDFSSECAITNEAPFQCEYNDDEFEDNTCNIHTISTETPWPMTTQATASSTNYAIITTVSDLNLLQGLNTMQLTLAILIPLGVVACVFFGCGICLIYKKQQREHAVRRVPYHEEEDDYNVIHKKQKRVLQKQKHEHVDSSEAEAEAEMQYFIDSEQVEGVQVPIYVEAHEGETNGGHVHGDEIGIWLKSVSDIYYNDYYHLFIERGYDEIRLIKSMSDKALKEIGIIKIFHRKNLLMEIQKLQNNDVTPN